jgi:hypothetical protein
MVSYCGDRFQDEPDAARTVPAIIRETSRSHAVSRRLTGSSTPASTPIAPPSIPG